MKTTTLLLALGLSSTTFADCGTNLVYEKLSRLNGIRTLGDCVVEFHVCEKPGRGGELPDYFTQGDRGTTNSWKGDVYIKHRDGRAVYVPIFSLHSGFPGTLIRLRESTREISYLYQDKNFDPVSGLRERYELKVFRNRKRIEVRMSNSIEARKHPLRSLILPDVYIACEQPPTKG